MVEHTSEWDYAYCLLFFVEPGRRPRDAELIARRAIAAALNPAPKPYGGPSIRVHCPNGGKSCKVPPTQYVEGVFAIFDSSLPRQGLIPELTTARCNRCPVKDDHVAVLIANPFLNLARSRDAHQEQAAKIATKALGRDGRGDTFSIKQLASLEVWHEPVRKLVRQWAFFS